MSGRRCHLLLKVLFLVAGGLGAALCQPGAASAASGWTWPVTGEVITPYRNGNDAYAAGQHRGIDVAAPHGTPVFAASAGSVRFAGIAGSSGLTLSVRTGDGRYDTSYLHLASTTVGEGDRIRLGQRIGAVGTSGRRSAAQPHLHFGVRDADSRHAYRDPLGLLPPPGTPAVREIPRPAPLPGLGPRLAPARSPVRSPAPSRSPRRAPAPGRVRAPAARRAPVPAGRRIPTPAGFRAPVPGGLPLKGPVRGPARRGIPARGVQPAPAPAHGPAGAPAPAPVVDPPAARTEHPREASDPARGPSLGWALACAGLLLAAACLGRPDGRGQRGLKESRSVRSLLRPLLGRR